MKTHYPILLSFAVCLQIGPAGYFPAAVGSVSVPERPGSGFPAGRTTLPAVAETKGGRSLMDMVRESGSGSGLQSLRNKVRTYDKDGRKSIVDLYEAQWELQRKPGWVLEEIFREEITLADGEPIALPSNCLRTAHKGEALWILTGIHGEEPAGPNALAGSLDVLVRLEKQGIPLVVMPLLNPLGYQKNWRYPNAAVYSASKPGSSVGDSDHLLPDGHGKPRRATPACREAERLTAKVLDLARDYPPALTLDLHEDNLLEKGYVYSQGRRGAADPVALNIADLFLKRGFPILMQGTTRFGEAVRKGIVSNVKDGSIDELLSAPTVIVNGSAVKGPDGGSILVLETSSKNTPLADRMRVHTAVIASLESLWQTATSGPGR
jgi:hypothetical protein